MSNISKPKTYLLKTYGCQMNFSDSERIETVLQGTGLKRVKDIHKADVIIFNTCSVRQSAEDRILGLGKKIKQLKNKRNDQSPNTNCQLPARTHPNYTIVGGSVAGRPITVLTGCMSKRSWDGTINEIARREKKYLALLRRKMPWIDIVIEIKDIAKLRKLLELQQCDHVTIQQFNNLAIMQIRNYLNIPPTFKSQISASVPISTGCNEFCTYCIVPYARGKQIDRPATEIINEVQTLVKKGYKDIMLLGQSVNSWKNPSTTCGFKVPSLNHSDHGLNSINTFLDLIKTIDNIKGDFWLTFLSSHPKYFTDELIDYFAKSACRMGSLTASNNVPTHIRPYLNLALQSGSNKILKRMNRKYTVEKFIRICKKLKKEIPYLNLSTDIIVGFPGETEQDFLETVKVFEELEFDMAYINKYSPRAGTASAFMKDNVPLKIKKEREKILTKILRETALRNNLKYRGEIMRVLIERIDKKRKLAFGKMFNFKDIKIPLKTTNKITVGDFIKVKVDKVSSFHLEGTIE